LNTILILEEKNVFLENGMEDLKNKISDLESYKRVIEVHYSKNAETKNHIKSLESQICELNDLLNNLKSKNVKMEDKDHKYDELKSEFDTALDEILQLEDKIGVFEKSNKELIAKIVDLENINSNFLSGRKKLDDMLRVGRSYDVRSGLGYLFETVNTSNPKIKSIKFTQRPLIQFNN